MKLDMPALVTTGVLLVCALASGPVAATANEKNCALTTPPDDAGETQAHGIILYVYPRNSAMDKNYTGCQTQWFYDDDHFRKLNIIHYQNGKLVAYDKLTVDGQLAYQCIYKDKHTVAGDEGRCPTFENLDRASYRSGCYSLSYLNESDSYNLAFRDCVLK